MKHGGVSSASECDDKKGSAKPVQSNADGIYLFATKTCPNCKMSANMLEKAGIKYEKIYAEDNKDAVAEYGIIQAPTLVVVKGGTATQYRNASNIKKYIENAKG